MTRTEDQLTVEELARIGSVETPTDAFGYFTLRTPALLQGITTDTRARTERLSVVIKVYAGGGENEMHSHMNEDHAFVLLSGRATFHVGSEEAVRSLNPFEGVLLPEGVQYRFSADGDQPLVMLRVAAVIDPSRPSSHKDLSFIPERIPSETVFFPDDLVETVARARPEA